MAASWAARTVPDPPRVGDDTLVVQRAVVAQPLPEREPPLTGTSCRPVADRLVDSGRSAPIAVGRAALRKHRHRSVVSGSPDCLASSWHASVASIGHRGADSAVSVSVGQRLSGAAADGARARTVGPAPFGVDLRHKRVVPS